MSVHLYAPVRRSDQIVSCGNKLWLVNKSIADPYLGQQSEDEGGREKPDGQLR